MHEHAISAATRNVIDLLVVEDLLKDFYLAGGTALAIQAGHRLSEDLDFFSPTGFSSDALGHSLGQIGDFRVSLKDGKTLTGLLNGVKISFFEYPYPILFPLGRYRRISLASPEEIGLMNMTAIAGRGAKKDFYDLYLICHRYMSLQNLLEKYPEKFKGNGRYHMLRSLSFFDDAERDPEPVLLDKSLRWGAIKDFFGREAPRLLHAMTET